MAKAKTAADGTIVMGNGKPLMAGERLTAEEVLELIELVAPRVAPQPQVIFGHGGGNRVSRLTDLIDYFPSYAGRALETLKVDRNGAAVTTAPENVNIKLFGATGDGVTNDAPAIQAAIDALPTAGGMVYIPPGTYRITTTLTLANKPITFVGVGGASIISLGSSVIAAFTVPSGLTVVRYFEFRDFAVTGGGTVGQELFRHSDTGGRGWSLWQSVVTSGVETIFNFAAYDTTYSRPTFVVSDDCDFRAPVNAGSTLVKSVNPAGTFAGAIVYYCRRTRLTDDGTGTFNTWTVNFDGDLFIDWTFLPMKTGSQVNGLIADGAVLRITSGNFTLFTHAWDIASRISDCFFAEDSLSGNLVIKEALCHVTSSQFQSMGITLDNDRIVVTGCEIRQGLSTAIGIDVNAKTLSIITGCHFRGWTTAAIRLASAADCVITGCLFSTTVGNTVLETGSSNGNLIAGCRGLDTGTALSLLGATTRVDGLQPGNASGVVEGTGKANANVTAVGNVDTGEDNLITYTLPALALLKVGSAIKIKAWGTAANNGNAKTVKLYFGVVVLTYALTAGAARVWCIEATIVKNGASTQDAFARLTETPGNVIDQEITAPNQVDTAAITIKCTGEGVATNDIVQEGLLVEVMN